jgi:hypothetical protein
MIDTGMSHIGFRTIRRSRTARRDDVATVTTGAPRLDVDAG